MQTYVSVDLKTILILILPILSNEKQDSFETVCPIKDSIFAFSMLFSSNDEEKK